jgi:hypothetical protein
MTEKSEGLGISGFTLGVMGIILSGWIGLITSLVGLMFCIIQQRKHKTRFGKIGFILNLISIALSIAFLVLYSTVIGPLLNQFPSA